VNRYRGHLRFAPLGEAGQYRLRKARVALVGMGALGSSAAGLLARAGVGFLRLCDRDFVERDNLQRQALYDEEDVQAGLPKAVAAAARLGRINAEVALDPRVVDVDPTNVEGLVGDVDLVVDGTDNFGTRFLLNDACVKLGKPWIYGGCVGSRGMMMAVRPGEGPCFACLAGEPPAPGAVPTCEAEGILNTVPAAVAALQATEAFKILAGRTEALLPGLVVLDLWRGTRRLLGIPRLPGCETCVRRRFRFLEAVPPPALSLCGRDAVQVRPPTGGGVDLEEVERRLACRGPILRNAHLLRFSAEGCEITLFPDARAIIRGTGDPARARSLYDRYVGS